GTSKIMHSLLKDIPPDSLKIQFLGVGQGLAMKDGYVHAKSVPYTIIAQVLQGRYQVLCAGRTTWAEPGEAFVTGAHEPLVITHHGDPKKGGVMKARW